MRLKELLKAEHDFLIINGWHSIVVRKVRAWAKGPYRNLTQDEAVRLQKAIDLENPVRPDALPSDPERELAVLRSNLHQAEAQWRRDQDTITALREQVEMLEELKC